MLTLGLKGLNCLKGMNQFLTSFFWSLYRSVRFAAFLMRKILSQRKKATILFATETGRSEGFARNLAKLMSHSFDVKVGLELKKCFVLIDTHTLARSLCYTGYQKQSATTLCKYF